MAADFADLNDHPCHGLGMAAESCFEDIAVGIMPGPDQNRSGIRLLLGAGLIMLTGTKVLDVGAGPDLRVSVYGLTMEGFSRWQKWTT
jgi:hypothetical protein